jgi:putative transcriptional regulator
MRKAAFAVLLTLLTGGITLANAADIDKPLILIAKPELRDELYGSSILIVTPIGNDQHAGFILNRPTDVTLGKIFPDHGPSQKIIDPVYRGGPVEPQVIFALVQRPDSPGGNAVEIMPGLFAVLEADAVDHIIEADSSRARFMAGLVVWRPGELKAEIDKGAWFVKDADAALAMRKPEGLWEELVHQYRIRTWSA